MIRIDYPVPTFKIKEVNAQKYIWDGMRKKWMLLTPEEWVRQNFIAYMIQVKNYPAAMIAVEKSIQVGELKKRFDIVVFKNMLPWIIVECKEPAVSLDMRVFEQLSRYNMTLSGSYLIITNGEYTKGWQVSAGFFNEINQLPDWHASG